MMTTPSQSELHQRIQPFGTSVSDDEDAPTPKLLHGTPETLAHARLQPFAASGDCESVDSCEFDDEGATPLKRERDPSMSSPLSDSGSVGVMRAKRAKDKVLGPSYTDPNQIDKIPSNYFFGSRAFGDPDDIDGDPLDEAPPVQRASTLVLPIPPSTRPLFRRATDFPMPLSPTQTYQPSPRSTLLVLEKVYGLTAPSDEEATKLWRKKRDDNQCPICMGVLVRPVDVVGCGHYVCRSHVIDMYQHGGSKTGIRCAVCRKEDELDDFNKIEVDQKKWSEIQRAKFHHARRKSVSPSRSLTPLRDRFNRRFLNDVDF